MGKIYKARKKHRASGVILVIGFYCVYVGLSTLAVGLIAQNQEEKVDTHAIHKRAIEDTGPILVSLGVSEESVTLAHSVVTEKNCTPRAIEEFPKDFFTHEQRSRGGVAIHLLLALYTFAALAIVCDDYFVSSLEQICDVMHLQPDVAGATFMAAGSSAPELFTSIIGVFIAKSDVGISTIVGSAVFNILFITATCGLFAGMVIHLTWWPLVRDSTAYLISVMSLILVTLDQTVHWYEGVAFLCMYVLYILLMIFNPRIGNWATNKVSELKEKRQRAKSPYDTQNEEKKPLIKENPNLEGGLETSHKSKRSLINSTEIPKNAYTDEKRPLGGSTEKGGDDDEEFESPLSFPDTCLKRLVWIVMLPVSLVFFFTIPDCRRPGCWRKLWMGTFIMSVAWIAALAYLMVWMVTIVGDTLGIPDTVMGLTLLAAGTSVPDCLSSIFVARDGYGDMAISNAIGSNVFDILACLGLPWFIQTVIIDTGGTVPINSAGMTFSAISLLGTVIFMLLAITINSWKLNKKLGVTCLVVYAIFIVFACLYELNVFGYMNPPSCPRMPGY